MFSKITNKVYDYFYEKNFNEKSAPEFSLLVYARKGKENLFKI